MKDPHIQLWAEDEVHFQRHTTLTRMWAPKGQQPRVISASTRQKIGFFGAINLKTGSLLTQKDSPFNADTFRNFLHYLLQHTQGKIHLILDKVSYHRAQDLKEFLKQNQYNTALSLFFYTAILPGSQSHRTSLENYSTTKNAQSLLRIDRKTRRNLNLTFFEMGATK